MIQAIQKLVCAISFLLYFHNSVTADSGPSFSCSGNTNETERRICDDALLRDLDVRMARFFSQAQDGVRQERREDFFSEQSLWLQWRNTCGEDSRCIRRRYEQRIIDLAPPDELPVAWQGGGVVNPPLVRLGTTNSTIVVERRITDNHYEVELADGTIRWQDFDGGRSGTEYPDGRGTSDNSSQAPPPDFPELPDLYATWGDGVEVELLKIIDRLLRPTDRAEYRNLIASKSYTVRIYDHIRTIAFLTVH